MGWKLENVYVRPIQSKIGMNSFLNFYPALIGTVSFIILVSMLSSKIVSSYKLYIAKDPTIQSYSGFLPFIEIALALLVSFSEKSWEILLKLIGFDIELSIFVVFMICVSLVAFAYSVAFVIYFLRKN